MIRLIFLVLIAFSSQALAGKIYDSLTGAQKTDINLGRQVMVLTDVAGAVWPRVTVYQAGSASPEEFAAVFSDYDSAVNYVPNLLKSTISKRMSSTQVWVDYILDVPFPIPNEAYTVEDTLSHDATDGSFRVDWHLIKATSTKSTVGFVQVEALGTESLVVFQNFMVPGIPGAGAVRGNAIQQVQDTIQSTWDQTLKLKANSNAHLQELVLALKKALNLSF